MEAFDPEKKGGRKMFEKNTGRGQKSIKKGEGAPKKNQ